jgi:hypothetical protein
VQTNSPSPISQVIGRIKTAWSEMDYAQRRVFEIRTGIPVEGRQPRRRPRPAVDELETLYRG